jgi:hypothetical protein
VRGSIHAVTKGDVSGEIGDALGGKRCYVHEICGDITPGAVIHGDVGRLRGECLGTVEGEILAKGA